MSRIVHLHLVSQNENKTYKALLCEREESGACKISGDVFDVSSAAEFPFLDKLVCYEVLLGEEDASDSRSSVCGCLAIRLPDEETVNKELLKRVTSEQKGVKMKLNKCIKAVDKQKNFVKVITEEFDSEVSRTFSYSKYNLFGGHDAETAKVAALLFCVGFYKKTNVLKVLATLEELHTSSEWFSSLGDSDAEWRTSADTYETFKDLFRAARGNLAGFKKTVDSLIAKNPAKFFCGNTRPMALRALGQMHGGFFVAYCKNKLRITLHEDDISNVDPADEQMFLQPNNNARALLDVESAFEVNGLVINKCVLAAFLTLKKLDKLGKLFITHENGDERDGHDVHVKCSDGRVGGVEEVHADCSQKRVFAIFDTTSKHSSCETNRKTFLHGQRVVAASISVKDAHLLEGNAFAHLLWKISKRIKIKKLTLTSRNDWDSAYVSRFWKLVKLTFKEQQSTPRALSTKVVSETESLKNFTEWSDVMSDYCVVPTAADAADVRGFNAGDRVFSVSPPLVGTALETNWKTTKMKTILGTVVVVCTSSVYKSKTNGKGAVLWPVSSMVTINREILPRLAVLTPRNDSVRKQQMCAIAARVAREVVVFEIDEYNKAHWLRIEEDQRMVCLSRCVPA